MSKKTIIKIALDVVMTGILVLLYNSHVFSLLFHEIAGLIIVGLFVTHCLLNYKWILSVSSKFFGKGLSARVRVGYVINFLLLITFTLVIISGISISQALSQELAAPQNSPWRYIHYFSSALAIILVGIHLGLHWGFIMRMFKKIIKVPLRISKPLSIGLLAITLTFGVYSIFTSSLITWLTDPFTITTTQKASASDGEIKNVSYDQSSDSEQSKTVKEEEVHTGNSDSYSDGEEKDAEGSVGTVLNTMATHLSIISVFAAIAYYLGAVRK